ncbi:ribosome modulation factor [Rubellimicrobium aerolatum]|uniref:Rmf/CrpP family protein n=1 Tax=Rubellimicrobium aerolatum TaxID=490979 RepID=A0ABW0SEG3_9RHOB|nr:Rmf/CrpP family protein [Rubellimicrobium aerolatum]MBP1805651.1 ribosome modulation factor [Rubellimicrobium aerolatum]
MSGDPYEEGRDACERGVARGDCPYPQGSPAHDAWIRGWDGAEEFRIVEGTEEDPREG